MAKRKAKTPPVESGKTYTYASGLTVPWEATTPELRKADAAFTALFKEVESFKGRQDKLIGRIDGMTRKAFEKAREDGRRQVTLTDPMKRRRVSISYHISTSLDDAAWAAKEKIDDYIKTHTRAEGEDAANLLGILGGVFSGSRRLVWNSQMQAFCDLRLRDAGLREAQKIIKAAKRTEESRAYIRVERFDAATGKWDEVLKL